MYLLGKKGVCFIDPRAYEESYQGYKLTKILAEMTLSDYGEKDVYEIGPYTSSIALILGSSPCLESSLNEVLGGGPRKWIKSSDKHTLYFKNFNGSAACGLCRCSTCLTPTSSIAPSTVGRWNV